MEVEIHVPEEVPAMTLPNVTFFPQALLPLHIFEPRYQQMLRDVLATNRIFAVAGLNSQLPGDSSAFEPPHKVACIGLVRACQENENGTSNLLIQGLCRVSIEAILGDEPYRRIRIKALASEPGASAAENVRLRNELDRLIKLKLRLSAPGGKGMTDFLKTVADPEIYVDIAAFNLCENQGVKQKLLETLDVNRRLALFQRQLRSEIDAVLLRKKLQGNLPDDKIPLN